jgi:hypothetical protein
MRPKRTNYRNIDRIQSSRIAKNMSEISGMHSRRVSGSGSDWRAKGDVYTSLFLFEGKDKAQPSKQRTIYKDVFDKIAAEAIYENKIPVYAVGFGDGRDFMIMEDRHWYEIVDRMVTAEKERDELREENAELREEVHDWMNESLKD